jgi:hypothetical protein
VGEGEGEAEGEGVGMERTLREASNIDLRIMWDVAAAMKIIGGRLGTYSYQKNNKGGLRLLTDFSSPKLSAHNTVEAKFATCTYNVVTSRVIMCSHMQCKLCVELDIISSCWKKTLELYSISSLANTVTASFMWQNRVTVQW